jgi:hypothetical protein
MPTLGEYLEQTGTTREELLVLLTERGVELKPSHSKMALSRPLPKRWLDALGIADQQTLDDEPTVRDRFGPSEPPGAKQAPLPVAVGQLAAERISSAYAMIGGGVGAAIGEPKVGEVFGAYSDPIGAAWVKAAEENEFAARVVKLASAGGATGELVTMHIVLVGGLLYVTGRAPALSGLYSRRFGAPPVAAPRPVAEPRAGDETADDALGDAAAATA